MNLRSRTTLRTLPTLLLGLVLALLMSAPVLAQDWGDSSETAREPAPRRTRSSGTVRGHHDYTGPYAQFGVSIGRIDFAGGVDSGASGGFTLAGGYRFLSWLSGEAHFQFLGGTDNADVGAGGDRDSQAFAFTFGPKVYPFGIPKQSPLPDQIQPYAFIGIGGGEAEVDGIDKDSSFIARIVLGVDFWITDQFGAFVEGGGYAAEEDNIDGVGVFTFGAQARF